jgi:hypothetical protein
MGLPAPKHAVTACNTSSTGLDYVLSKCIDLYQLTVFVRLPSYETAIT